MKYLANLASCMHVVYERVCVCVHTHDRILDFLTRNTGSFNIDSYFVSGRRW